MPTEIIQIPAGTYNLAGGGSRTVTALTVVADQATPAVGSTVTFTTNATSGATFSIRREGVEVESGIVGTDPLEINTTGYTAGDTMTCRVISGAQDVTSTGVDLTSPSLTYVDFRVARSGTATTTPSITFDLSAAQAGDELFVIYSNPTTGDPTACTVSGASAGAIVATLGTQDQNRTQWIWKYTMPGAGSGTAAVAFSIPTSTNNHICSIGIVRGGAVIGASSLVAGSSATSFATSVTPTDARNIILASLHCTADHTGTSWTNATGQTSGTGRAAIARHEDATISVSRTITATTTAAVTGSLSLLCLEPA